MKLYEGMFLFDSNLASRDWPGLERHVEDLLKKNSAELRYTERWPDRKLAYGIKGRQKGTYYLTYFHAPSEAIAKIERDCQLSDRILRLLVLQEEGLQQQLEKRLKKRAERPNEPEDSPDPEDLDEKKNGDSKLRR